MEIFGEALKVDGLVMTKLDGTAKGGILAAIADEHPTPVFYIGVGESIEDLNEFNATEFAKGLMGIR